MEESAGNSALSFDISQCTPLGTESVPGGDFSIALMDSVRPGHAPVPGNASERVVFSQLYETLVKVGCDGTLQSGLADHWSCTDDGTTWVFRIRDGAVFWDGTRVTASLVKRAWIKNQKIPPSADHVSPWAWLNARSKSVKVMDAQHLAIQLPEAQVDFPLLLAHPATSVALIQPGWQWPVGSGPGRLKASTPAPLPDLNVTPNIHHPASPIWKALHFLVKPDQDARDLIVLDPDLLVVGDLTSVDFFRGAPGYLVSPLPWQRLYLLVCPPEQNPTGNDRWTHTVDNLDRYTDLSGVATRPWAHLTFPATGSLDCPQLTGPIPRSVSQGNSMDRTSALPDKDTLLYCSDDPGSQELAMRLAALGDASIKVQGAPVDQMGTALKNQSPGAFILAIDRHYPSGCLQLASLLGRAIWLQQAATSDRISDLENTYIGEGSPISAALIHSGIITPLLMTHPFIVHKGNLAGVGLDFDGTLNLDRLGMAP